MLSKELNMKALEFLKQERAHHLAIHNDKSIIDQYDEAIKELEAHITTYQVIRRRLDQKVVTIAVLQEENRSLLKILTQINEEVLNIKD